MLIFAKNILQYEENKKDYILIKAEKFIEPLTETEALILDFIINDIGNGKEVSLKEIKKYVDEIVTASREDFLNLEVNEGEFYLSEVMNATQIYYGDKLSVLQSCHRTHISSGSHACKDPLLYRISSCNTHKSAPTVHVLSCGAYPALQDPFLPRRASHMPP